MQELRYVGAFLKSMVGAIPVVFTFADWIGYPCRIHGRSMYPLLNPDPYTSRTLDIVWLNRWALRKFETHRGEIVVLISPKCADEYLIKRVIGLEGDLIRTTGYKKKYVTVPEGYCWIEGENQKHSLDSNTFGPVPVGLIVGKVNAILWPPSRIQTLKHELSTRKPVKMGSSGWYLEDEVDYDD